MIVMILKVTLKVTLMIVDCNQWLGCRILMNLSNESLLKYTAFFLWISLISHYITTQQLFQFHLFSKMVTKETITNTLNFCFFFVACHASNKHTLFQWRLTCMHAQRRCHWRVWHDTPLEKYAQVTDFFKITNWSYRIAN